MKKRYFASMTLALTLLIVPVGGYAIIDVAAYGGYNFGDKAYHPTVYGPHVGVIVHPSITLAKILTLGIGAYYQRSYAVVQMNYLYYTRNKLTTRDSVGLDGFIQISIPKINLCPFGRVTTNIWDQVDGYRVKSLKQISASEFFKSYSLGGGIAFPFATLPVIDKVYIYLEYLYNISKIPNTKANSHTAHAGVRVII